MKIFKVTFTSGKIDVEFEFEGDVANQARNHVLKNYSNVKNLSIKEI